MRTELKELSPSLYWVDGLSDGDFYHSVGIVNDMIFAGREALDREVAFLRSRSETLTLEAVQKITALNDRTYSFLWQFALLRLHGQFEAILVTRFLGAKSNNRSSLGENLRAVRNLGFSLSADEESELRSWTRLRNAFTHAPPEASQAVPLTESDIDEFANLLITLYRRWCQELPGQRSLRGKDGTSRNPGEQRE